MRGLLVTMTLAAGVPAAAAAPLVSSTLSDVLQRAGERVERYLARAQSIVCIERVHLQPISMSWSSDGFGRTVESALHLSWAATEGDGSAEAHAIREVLRVNGRKPRADDRNNCTTPEQETREPQPLSLLLPRKQLDYEFKITGQARVDRRTAIMVDYRLLTRVTVDSHMVEGREDCVSFNVEGGMRGRIWIDAETHDVLRLDQSLIGMVDIPLPKRVTRRPGSVWSWTMERWDTSIRFKAVSFTNPDEVLLLPATMSSLQITRGAGTPRLRTTTEYVNYQRFLTGGRVISE